MQRPENLVYFFRDVGGVGCIEPAVLASRTPPYRAWVREYTAERGIPMLAAAKGRAKRTWCSRTTAPSTLLRAWPAS